MDDLLNWTCQAMVVTGVTTGVLARARSLNASTRHVIWWLTLVVVIAMGAGTLMSATTVARQDPNALAGWSGPALALPDAPIWAPIAIAVLWAGWMAISMVRLVVGLSALFGLRRALTEVGPDRQARLATWSRLRTTGRRARLVSAPGLGSACLLGLHDPIVAVPSWMLEHLDDEAIDQIVVHEWAHLQRRDDFAALAQAIVRTIAGWHPIILWIDRAIRFEREVACDDWVVAFTKDRTRYASCLAAVAAARSADSSTLMAPALAAPGRTALARRIVRLLASERAPEVGIAPRAISAAGLGLLVTAISVAQVQAVGVPEPRMTKGALPPPPSVYWAASFRVPTAPVLRPSRTTSFSASVRASGWREGITEEVGRPTGEVARQGLSDRPLSLTPGAPGDVLPGGRPAGFERPTLAPVVAATWTARPRGRAGDSSGTLWAPALHVSEGAVRMSQGLSRGSRGAAVSTGRFFARVGRSIAAASPRTEGSRPSDADRQP